MHRQGEKEPQETGRSNGEGQQEKQKCESNWYSAFADDPEFRGFI